MDHANARNWNPDPLDAVVGVPDQSDGKSALHVTAGTGVQFLPFLRKAAGNEFKRHLRLNAEKTILRGGKGDEVPPLA